MKHRGKEICHLIERHEQEKSLKLQDKPLRKLKIVVAKRSESQVSDKIVEYKIKESVTHEPCQMQGIV